MIQCVYLHVMWRFVASPNAYLRNKMMEVAKLFTFKGKTSPKRAKVTGPTPSP